ncbi:MAG TPA: class I SAM-dependent methyltransferase family protein [Chloroflexia bacterium]|nr:class I SAM-dependent methyltransferase family protein [Chloroflexia bacterium]
MQQTFALKWHLLSWLMRRPGRASTGIALGYDQGFDSGPMLDYVYENRAQGRFPLGALIDRVYLNAVGWRAIRARKALLKTVLQLEIAALRGQAQPVVVLDVAAGPGRYWLELAQELQATGALAPGDLQVICRDLDARGLALGRERAARLGVSNVRFETGDATDARSLGAVDPRPQIVVVSGLYELFANAGLIRQSMQAIAGILPPGGRLIFTTQVQHPQLEFIARVLVNRDGQPWEMVCRSLDETAALARSAGFTVLHSQLEHVGLFGITVCEKAADPGPRP